jgi:predicted nucleotidyltransferase
VGQEHIPSRLATAFEPLLSAVLDACHIHYGRRLTSVALFGSVGRGTPRPDSDLDLLIIADGLPAGRMRRIEDFAAVETAVASAIARAERDGLSPLLSPVFKTPAEAAVGSPLFLDMTEDARLLFDRNAFLANLLAAFRARLERLGARRIWRGNAWLWDLKPDYRVGEEFEL